MGTLAYATLTDGRRLPYMIVDDPPRGAMKHTYFAPDRSYVVQFFNHPEMKYDRNMRRRLEAIIGRYNPTLSESDGGARGGSEETAQYFSHLFCWPCGIVDKPEFGIVSPAYPSNFFFDADAAINPDLSMQLKGKDKRSKWFTSAKLRQYLKRKEIGDFRAMLDMSILLARAVRRMHQAGLSHSDLSCNNVLIDPLTGGCSVIDIDSLVVPGLYPPQVSGTPGYIAPEVLKTVDIPFDDPHRKLPCTETDLHAMAVLIYEYLLLRHPLIGPKIYSDDAEEDDYMMMGPKALFIEHPKDGSNRPGDLGVTIMDLGPELAGLFRRAFVDGLHAPRERPSALEWEMALVRSRDLLHPCENPECAARWFVLHDPSWPVCPFCGRRVRQENLLRLRLKRPMRGAAGHWIDAGEIDAYNDLPLFSWHMEAGRFPDEKADRNMRAYISRSGSRWMLVNRSAHGMVSPGGRYVGRGQAVELENGAVFRAQSGERGLLIEVSCGK